MSCVGFCSVSWKKRKKAQILHIKCLDRKMRFIDQCVRLGPSLAHIVMVWPLSFLRLFRCGSSSYMLMIDFPYFVRTATQFSPLYTLRHSSLIILQFFPSELIKHIPYNFFCHHVCYQTEQWVIVDWIVVAMNSLICGSLWPELLCNVIRSACSSLNAE